MTARKVTHAWNPLYSKARCGVETLDLDPPWRSDAGVTCRRCLSILSGERRVGGKPRSYLSKLGEAMDRAAARKRKKEAP